MANQAVFFNAEKQRLSKLRIMRELSGMTQAELAKGIISVPELSRAENNQHLLPKNVLEQLASRIGCDLSDLIENGDIFVAGNKVRSERKIKPSMRKPMTNRQVVERRIRETVKAVPDAEFYKVFFNVSSVVKSAEDLAHEEGKAFQDWLQEVAK